MLRFEDYKQLFNASLDAIVRIDSDAKIMESNESFCSLFKYSREELIGRPLDAFIVQDKLKEEAELLNRRVTGGKIFSSEVDRVDKNGLVHHVIVTGIPILDEYDFRGSFVIYKDVSGEIRSNVDLLKQKMTFESLFRNSNDAIVRIDINQRVLDINERFEILFGYDLSEIKGQLVDRLISSSKRLNESVSLTKELLTGEKIKVEGVRYGKNGKPRIFIVQGVPIIVDNEVIGGYGIYTDITESKKAEKKIEAQKVIFEALFKNSSDAIVRFDSRHCIIDINENFTQLFKYSIDEIRGKRIDEVVNKTDMKDPVRLTHLLLQGETFMLEGERYDKYDEKVEVSIKGVPIIAGGKVIGGYGIYSDISARKSAENEILYMSYHDQLTGVYNRRFFEEEFNRYNAKRYMPISLIMADVNGLKLINDAFGHEAGDELLKRMARVLGENCRDGEVIARLGGDEFVILLPSTDEYEAEAIVKRIKSSCHNEAFKNIEFSMSFGWDSKTTVDESIKDLFKRVEDQMYRNKLVESPSIRGKMFDTVIKTLHAKNEREERHSSRVSEYSELIAKSLCMNSIKVKELKTAGWLHDIGKIAISDSILDKTGKLDDEEWKEVKKHPEIGYRILNSVNEFTELSEHILSHHERYDGKGYPKGLKGDEIPLQSRIIAIADAYDAMTSDRTYRNALSENEAIQQLKINSGTQFDPLLVDVFVGILEEKSENAEMILETESCEVM